MLSVLHGFYDILINLFLLNISNLKISKFNNKFIINFPSFLFHIQRILIFFYSLRLEYFDFTINICSHFLLQFYDVLPDFAPYFFTFHMLIYILLNARKHGTLKGQLSNLKTITIHTNHTHTQMHAHTVNFNVLLAMFRFHFGFLSPSFLLLILTEK